MHRTHLLALRFLAGGCPWLRHCLLSPLLLRVTAGAELFVHIRGLRLLIIAGCLPLLHVWVNQTAALKKSCQMLLDAARCC